MSEQGTHDNQPIAGGDTTRAVQAGPPRLERFFKALTKLGASDLHLKPGAVPHVRTKTVIVPTQSDELSSDDIWAMCRELLSQAQQEYFVQHGNIDVAYEIEGGDRFRMNIFRQRGHVAAAVRRVTRKIPDFQNLNLPPIVQRISEEHQGLVLLSGPTGSGKSTTIASMLEYINKTRPCHIVTIEDPIEYLYESKKALVSQREIGIDVGGFDEALKALMREDPDVVLIGEMRDRETFHAALQASETGHLVFGTVHASGAPQTIGRILELFPTEARESVRQSMSFNLRAIMCQKLLPSIKSGLERVPAVEIMLGNAIIRQMINEGRDAELGDAIRSHERDGMQSFTAALYQLIESEFIDPKVGYDAAPNVDELKMLLKGISASRAGLRR